MKYRVLIPLFCCLFVQAAFAQPRGNSRIEQRIEAMKAAFITERLQLTPEEAQQFWPLYNQYEEAERALRREYRPGKAIENMTEAEASAFLDRSLELEERLTALRRTYIERFKEILPTRKIALLREVEEEFKRELLRRMREMRRRQR